MVDAGPPARAAFVGLACLVPALCAAQDLTPRAYFSTPVLSNAVILTYTFSDGDVVYDPTLPVTDSTGTIHLTALSYYDAFDFFGRSANIAATLPFAVGDLRGLVSASGCSRRTTISWPAATRFKVIVERRRR
jgi:hypothetical protein